MTNLVKHEENKMFISFEQIEQLSESIAKAGLFGFKTKDQAMAIMMIAHAEGRHPALAVKEYYPLNGKIGMYADSMLARFQEAGGRVEWLEYSDIRAKATFHHPAGGSVTIDWDADRAKKAGLSNKDNYKNYGRSMYRARVISEGVRTVYPGCISGFYTPEELSELKPTPGNYENKNIFGVNENQENTASLELMKDMPPEIMPESFEDFNVWLEDLKKSKSMSELEGVWEKGKILIKNLKREDNDYLIAQSVKMEMKAKLSGHNNVV